MIVSPLSIYTFKVIIDLDLKYGPKDHITMKSIHNNLRANHHTYYSFFLLVE